MIRTILTFRVSPDVVSEIERIYAANGVLEYSLQQTRAVSSEIAVCLDDADGAAEIVVTALWPDEDAYQEWMDHPYRGAIAPGLPELVGPVGPARRYEVHQRVVKVERECAVQIETLKLPGNSCVRGADK